jgi:diguanylate cyclase (GGDEF)-like protein
MTTTRPALHAARVAQGVPPRRLAAVGDALTVSLFGGAYYTLALVSLHFVNHETGLTPMWLASGLALAALLLSARRSWLALAGATFVAGLAAQSRARGVGLESVLIAGVDTLEPWLAAVVLTRLAGRRRICLCTVREVCGLIIATAVACAATAVLAAGVVAVGYHQSFGSSWVALLAAHAVGMIVVAPFVVALARPQRGASGALETGAMAVVAIGFAWLMFSKADVGWPPLSRFAFTLSAPLLWVALRGGSRALTTILVAIGVIAAWGTSHGFGPIAHSVPSTAEAIRSFQLYMMTAVCSALLVAATMIERRTTEANLLAREAELAALNERLQEDARRDQLTGLRNRRALADDVRGFDALRGVGGRFALALCDVDRFKAYNDRLGHLAGDHALRAIATVVAGSLRERDVAYRFGGEELLLVLRGAGPREAMAVAERVRRAVWAAQLPHPDGIEGRFTVSIGVAAQADGYSELLAGADAALYEAKNGGRNRVVAAPGSDLMRVAARRPAISEEAVPRHLQSMLRLSRAAVSGGTVESVARALAQTIRSELSFRVVAVNLLDDDRRELYVAAVLGEQDAQETLAGARYDWAEWEPLLSSEHERCGAIWLPAESSAWESSGPTWTPSFPAALGADAWGPDDSLLLPLRGAGGDVLGVVSVDQPLSGRRPDDGELTVLMAVADHAGLVLEQVRLSNAQHAALRDQTQELRLAAVMLLAETLDLRHPSTAEHSRTVGSYARSIACALGLEPERVERIHAAGVLHDLGKLGVSDTILAKIGALDDQEWGEIRGHPDTGARILENAGLDDIATWVRAHHERIDGAGYPESLSQEEIPIEARILAVADAFEAMTSDRPYRSGMSREQAYEELRRCAGTQFDAAVVDAFLSTLASEDDAPEATGPRALGRV